tara:strand:+ start:58 stop:627 length:570 start_codon:yes stop_codon:yes gene_type:complete
MWVSKIPSIVAAGTTITWRDDDTTVPFDQNATSADWTLTYYLRSAVSGAHTAIGSAYNSGWQVTISATDSANFYDGSWSWEAVVSKGSEKFRLGQGTIEVRQSLSYTGTAGAIDTRSQNKIDRDNIKIALRKFADGMQEYSIGGRTFKRVNIVDLQSELKRLNAIVIREDIAEKVAQGLGNPTRFFVRF